MSSWLTSPASANRALAASGSSVWTWTLSVAWSPTTSTESPSRSSSGTNAVAVEALAGDDEVGAAAELGVGVVDLVEPRGGVVRDLRQLHLLAGEPGDHPADDHHQPERAGVDDPGLGEHVELLGRVADRLLAGEQRRRQHLGEQRVLLVRGGVRVEPLAQPLRAPLGDRLGHRPDHGQHRALGGLANRGVGRVAGVGERGLDQLRVDQPARRRRHLLRRPADDLAQDHAGVAARSHQRRARDLADDLRARRVAVGAELELVELVEHVAHRQRHVVAGVAVGDREHVQVVDLLAPLLEMGERDADHVAKANDR